MTVHLVAEGAASVTACCGRMLSRLVVDDRTTRLPDRVTCRPRPTTAQLLDFEAAHRRPGGRKEEAIRADLGLTPARYFQLLGRAVRTDEGRKHNAILCADLVERAARNAGTRYPYYTPGEPR